MYSDHEDAPAQRSRFWSFTVEKILPDQVANLPHLLHTNAFDRISKFKEHYYYYDPANKDVYGIVRTDKPVYETKIAKLLPATAHYALVDSLVAKQHYEKLVIETGHYSKWQDGYFEKKLPAEQGVPKNRSAPLVAQRAKATTAAAASTSSLSIAQVLESATAQQTRSRFWAFVVKNVSPEQLPQFIAPFKSSKSNDLPNFIAHYCYYDAAARKIRGLVRTAAATYETTVPKLLTFSAGYWPIDYLKAEQYHQALVSATLGSTSWSDGSFARAMAGEAKAPSPKDNDSANSDVGVAKQCHLGSVETNRAAKTGKESLAAADDPIVRVQVAKRLYSDTLPTPGTLPVDRFSLLEASVEESAPPAKRTTLASKVAELQTKYDNLEIRHGTLVKNFNRVVTHVRNIEAALGLRTVEPAPEKEA